jgi:hypothetical protein
MAQGDEADADADATVEAEAEGEMNVTAEQTADATTAAATSYHNIYSQGAANAPARKKRTVNIEVHRPGGRY